MAYVAREPVFAALLTLLNTMVLPVELQFKFTGRRLLMWDDESAANQPCMFLHQGPQVAVQNLVFPLTKWKWQASVWIYFRGDGSKDQLQYPDKIINQYLDAVDLVMQPQGVVDQFPERKTLGGLVWHAFIDGTVFFDDGIEDNQCIIIVPITVLVTSP